MNPLYNALMGNMSSNNSPVSMNPMQKFGQVMQAMRNPATFVKQAFPDIPAAIQNDPNQILQYLQQTRHISNEQIQNVMNQIPKY